MEIGDKKDKLTLKLKEKEGKKYVGIFICDCGQEIKCRLDSPRKDCGCSKKSDIPPARKNPYYYIWLNIKKKCYSPSFKGYLGDGTKVYEPWMYFKNFYYWAKDNHFKDSFLVRIDHNKDFSPENCKFVNRKELDDLYSITEKRKNTINKNIEDIGEKEYKKKIKEKVKQTSLERYGVEHPLMTKEVKDKRGKTNLQKYGDKIASRSEVVKEKIKNTNLDKYGVTCYFQTEDSKESVREYNRLTYGYDYKSQSPEYKDEMVLKMLGGQKETTSKKELEVKAFLDSFGYCFEKNFNDIIEKKEIDLYCNDLKLGIEYCGLYFHSDRTKSNNYHYEKYKACKDKGIQLITIFSDEWERRRTQVENRLMSLLGVNKKIYARKCEFKQIDNKVAKNFINNYHIQPLKKSPKYSFGLFYENKLMTVMSFSNHPRDNSKITLNRFCSFYGVTIIGGASKLFKNAIKYIPFPIYSWSDNRWSDGGIYEELGFELIKNLKPDYSYVKRGGKDRLPKQKYKKSLINCPQEITEKDFMAENGFYRIYDCGKKTYLYTL